MTRPKPKASKPKASKPKASKPKASEGLRQTADHEAAHALVASKLGIAVYATIIPCDEKQALGTTAPVAYPSEIDPAKLLAVCLAGVVGELARGLMPDPSHSVVDRKSATKVMREFMGIGADTPEENAATGAAVRTARDILVASESDRHAIADALLTHRLIHIDADGTIKPYEGNNFERRCLLRNVYGVKLA